MYNDNLFMDISYLVGIPSTNSELNVYEFLTFREAVGNSIVLT